MQIYFYQWTDCRLTENEDTLQTDFFVAYSEAVERGRKILELSRKHPDEVYPGRSGSVEWGNVRQLVQALNALNIKSKTPCL